MAASNRQFNLITRLWSLITGESRNVNVAGDMRGVARRSRGGSSLLSRQYDLEISEFPVRDPVRARELIEMREWCPEVASAIDWIRDDVPSSVDGDDQGFGIPDEGRYGNPVDKRVLDIARMHCERVWTASNLEIATDRLISYGDFFAEIDLQLTGERAVNGLMFLPTWEMFRIQDKGRLLGFEQRQYLSESEPIRFQPLKIVHGRYRQNHLYGRSLFAESLPDWAKLKDATQDLANASREAGINPTKHTLPEGYTREQRDAYADANEERMADGIISHYYMMPGVDIQKVSTINPDLEALANTVMTWRSRIVMKSGVPPYLLGLPAEGARDIAGQPALAYARRINRIRMILSECIRQTINTELALNEVPKELWTYRVKWPRFSLSVFNPEQEANPAEDPDIADTDNYSVLASQHGHTVYTSR